MTTLFQRQTARGIRRLAALTTCATALCFAACAHAQFRASLTGTVTDPQGAVVPGASVKLTDTQNGRVLTATTNENGFYTFNALPPDQFTLTTSMSGFKGNTIRNLTITPEQANNVNVTLAVGTTDTSVDVNADAIAPLETATASISGVVTSDQIQHMPSAGRDVFQLAQLTPGLFGDGGRSNNGGTNALPGTQGPRGTSATSGVFQTENGPQVLANGGQYETNSINIDGISTTSAVWGGTTVITPNEDSIDNVKITSNGYDAEFGRFSGANMQVTTKSGTNKVHGSFFFRVSRPGLNAFNRYNGPSTLNPFTPDPSLPNNNVNRAKAKGVVRDTSRYNDFGGSIGGPILKDRLFAFFAYETIRNNSQATSNPTLYETTAFDGSAPSGFISNKYTTFAGHSPVNATQLNTSCASVGLAEGTYCHAVNGGVDVGSPLKTAKGTQDLGYIDNTHPGVGGGLDGVADLSLYQTSTPSATTQVQYNGRLDGQVTQKDHLAFAIYWVPSSTQSINGPARGYNLWNHSQTNDAFSVIWNHTISPTFLNEARANAAGWRYNELTSNPQEPFGLPQDNINALAGAGSNGAIQFFGAPGPGHYNQWTYGYKDVATKVYRTHTFKFGADATQLHYLQDNLGGARPGFSFYNIWDFLNDAPFAESGQFNRFTGVPYSSRFDQREWIFGGFVQDDWKITPNLTLNMGIRYNYFGSLYAKQSNMPHLVFGSGATTFSGIVNQRGGDLWTPDKGNVGPQFGFAYNPSFLNKHFVIRGGYGLGYNQEELAISANASNNPNDAVPVAFNNSTPVSVDPHIQYNIPSDSHSIFGYAPNTNTVVSYGPNGLPTTSGFGVTGYPNHIRTQQVHHYSLDTQYDLGHQMVASVGYQGSTAKHLIFHQNAYVWGQAHGIAYNPSFSSLEYFGDTGGSNYNAMTVDLKHNMSHQFLLDASFQLAKSMDDNSGPYQEDPYVFNPVYLRGRSDFNVGKAFKVYGVYEPKLFYGHNALGKVLLNGFNISGIYNFHTGFPWTPNKNYGGTPAFYSGSGYNTLRPTAYFGNAGKDSSKNAFESAGLSPNFSQGGRAYFNAYAAGQLQTVTYPAPVVFYPTPGIARNSFTGPRYSSLDATVTKSFGIPNHYLGERTGLEFRIDAFNVLNLNNPSPSINTDIDSANLGVSSSGLAGRQVQMQARISF